MAADAAAGAGNVFVTEPQLPTMYSNKIKFTSSTHIGARGNQEDRFVACPDLFGGEYAWFGVYDGTVKEHASEWIHKHILPIFLETKSFKAFHEMSTDVKSRPGSRALLEDAFREAYREADRQLIDVSLCFL